MHTNIAIVLSTYNGEKYIEPLLSSLFEQSCQSFTLFIRDDGSSDRTVAIIRRWATNHDQIVIVPDEAGNIGPCGSYHRLLHYVVHLKQPFEYVMFADQDDVWFPRKIEKTLEAMTKQSRLYPDKPLLVHSDMKVVDHELKAVSPSFFSYQRLNRRVTALNRLVLQNNMSGCTIMINRSLAALALPIPWNAIMYDWWLGLVASAFGHISCLDEPTLLYRQHQRNSVGARPLTLLYLLNRINKPFSIEHHMSQAEAFLHQYESRLSVPQTKMLETFIGLRSGSLLQKLKHVCAYRLYKMDIIRNAGLLLALLGKLQIDPRGSNDGGDNARSKQMDGSASN